METKQFNGRIIKVHEQDRDGVKVGIVEGYGATWDLDRGDFFGVRDQFVRGAFLESIADHHVKQRQIRLKDHHGRTVGGFPINLVHEDEKGIFIVGEINLELQQGRELMALIRQKVITDFSIGFSIEESIFDEQEDIRTIKKAIIWEFSLVDEPMNPFANVTGFKSIVHEISIADRNTSWDAATATKNLENTERGIKAIYSQCGGLKVQILDIVDGDLKIIPRAVFLAAENIKVEEDGPLKRSTIKQLEKIYAKMGVVSPFSTDQKQYYTETEVKALTVRELEKALKNTGCFSKNAVKLLVSKLKLDDTENTGDNEQLKNLHDLMKKIKL